MHRKPYVGKYCKRGKPRKGLCRVLYVLHAVVLVLAAVHVFSGFAGEESGDIFVNVGATGVENGLQSQYPEDTTPPRILGVADIVTYEGDAVSYRSGIRVEDDSDSEAELTVDSSQVNLSRSGSYTVTYTASDAAGNRSSAEAKVTVLSRQEGYVDMETVYASADAALGVIITDDMTDRQKVEAIYSWCRKSCRYSGHTPREDVYQAAYSMLTTGTGDCYGYFAVSKVLFERLEIPSIDVTKVKNHEGDSEHFWSLVSVDGGESWYHFDATPRLGQTQDFCLVTDAVLDAYSEANNLSHNRDSSLYPATPEE